MEALVRGRPSREGARNASDLFLWAGLSAALLGGVVGMATRRPVVVVFSVLSLIGFVTVRWSLARQGADPGLFVAGTTAVSMAFISWILGSIVGGLRIAWVNLVVLPVLAVLLVYAAGMIVAQALIERHPFLVADVEDGMAVNVGLQASAGLLLAAPFVLVYLGASGIGGLVALTGVAAVYASAGGQLASAGRVPLHVAAGGSVALIGHAWYLVQFAGTAPGAVGVVVQGLPLAGMVLSAFPIALGIVALQSEVEGEDDLDVEEGPGPSESREHRQT